jgi:hypothetical protein
MNWRNMPAKCAECGKEFYPSDPRAIWCSEHHFAALGRMWHASAAGKPMLDAVADEIGAALQPTVGEHREIK